MPFHGGAPPAVITTVQVYVKASTGTEGHEWNLWAITGGGKVGGDFQSVRDASLCSPAANAKVDFTS